MKIAPLRAAGRVAWRSARRNLRRSALILVMVGLPVALVTAGATVARRTVPTPEDEIARTMGAADLVLTPGNRFDSSKLKERLPKGSDVVTTRYEEVTLIQGGALVNATLVEPDMGLDSSVLNGRYELQSGQVPRQAGEVALHADLLTGFDAQIGDEIELGGHALTLTGVARAPQDRSPHRRCWSENLAPRCRDL